MSSIFHVLIIDDDERYCEAFRVRASLMNWKVATFHSLEKGLEHLKKTPSINGIVLDAKCKLNEDSDPKDDFLNIALSEVKSLALKRERDLYITVNTGYADELRRYHSDVEMFQKGDQQDELFLSLKNGISSLLPTEVRKKYHAPLSILGSHFPGQNLDNDLLQLLLSMRKENLSAIKSNLTSLRHLYEAIILQVSKLSHAPNGISQYGRIRFLSGDAITVGKNGNEVVPPARVLPEYVEQICYSLWGLGSYGSHYKEDEIKCTCNSVLGSIYLLMDLLDWFDQWMDENS
jgi:hypothetical protein